MRERQPPAEQPTAKPRPAVSPVVAHVRLFVILASYLMISAVLSRWIESTAANALTALGLLLGCYWVPPQPEVRYAEWVGWSVLVAACVFLIGLNFFNSMAFILLTVFFISLRRAN